MKWYHYAIARLETEQKIAELETLLKQVRTLQVDKRTAGKTKNIEDEINKLIALAKEKRIIYRKMEEENSEKQEYETAMRRPADAKRYY